MVSPAREEDRKVRTLILDCIKNALKDGDIETAKAYGQIARDLKEYILTHDYTEDDKELAARRERQKEIERTLFILQEIAKEFDEALINPPTMPDGTEIDFGQKARLAYKVMEKEAEADGLEWDYKLSDVAVALANCFRTN